MAGERPRWDGLLKWSLSHADGTRPVRQLSEEDRKWFMEAMESQVVDVVKRMKQLTSVMEAPQELLDAQGVGNDDIIKMLDELQEHVESIDMANDLNAIGGLVPLLGYLKNSNAKIRAKAADVITTIVQNNPTSQKHVMEANGFEPLMDNFTLDSDMTSRTKALGAISSLITHNKLGASAFRSANGYVALKDALGSDDARLQRKALNLIHSMLLESTADNSVVCELGFPGILVRLASNQDPNVRESALRGLLKLVEESGMVTIAKCLPEDAELKQTLERCIDGISSMSSEDLGAAREEIQLVDSLWQACYNEPSSLISGGLLSLDGEDELPPDVASKMFEPPLRAWAANREAPPQKQEHKTPLLLGPLMSTQSQTHSIVAGEGEGEVEGGASATALSNNITENH